MTITYYRTDRTIAVFNDAKTQIEIRTYTAATSEAEARAVSRPIALAAMYPSYSKEILGREYVVVVPGITSHRAPEVRINGHWRPVTDNAD